MTCIKANDPNYWTSHSFIHSFIGCVQLLFDINSTSTCGRSGFDFPESITTAATVLITTASPRENNNNTNNNDNRNGHYHNHQVERVHVDSESLRLTFLFRRCSRCTQPPSLFHKVIWCALTVTERQISARLRSLLTSMGLLFLICLHRLNMLTQVNPSCANSSTPVNNNKYDYSWQSETSSSVSSAKTQTSPVLRWHWDFTRRVLSTGN